MRKSGPHHTHTTNNQYQLAQVCMIFCVLSKAADLINICMAPGRHAATSYPICFRCNLTCKEGVIIVVFKMQAHITEQSSEPEGNQYSSGQTAAQAMRIQLSSCVIKAHSTQARGRIY